MRDVRQMAGGLIFALVSVVLVVGGLSLALAESYTSPRPSPTESLPAILPTLTPSLAGAVETPTSTASASQTPPPPVNCQPPDSWVAVSIQPGETLALLAARYKIPVEQLRQANCLLTDNLASGYTLYVPPVPTNTPLPCGAPFGWVQYTVQPGDTLYHISVLYGVTVGQLQQANCKGYSTSIRAGERLWVPNVPPRSLTPGITDIPDFPTPTEVPTEPLTTTPLPFTRTPLPTHPPSTPTPTPMPPTPTLTALPSDAMIEYFRLKSIQGEP